jgi:hypothetical protein
MSLIRGVLLAGRFHTQHELNTLSADNQRNRLIFELSTRTKHSGSSLQASDDLTVAAWSAVFVFLREAKIRTDAQLKTMSADDQRNTLIVEVDAQTNLGGAHLQSLKNMDLVLLALGKEASSSLTRGTFLRGVLVAGRFATQHELNKLSADSQRNRLIFELSTRTKHSGATLQGSDDFVLAGWGAVFVLLREAGIRTDAQLKTMTADDQRNTLIVEVEAQTKLGIANLQGLRNMDLVRLALGVEARSVFTTLPPPLQQLPRPPYRFSIDNFQILTQRADGDHSDSDWLTFIVTIGDPITKKVVTLPVKDPVQVGGSVKTGDIMRGPFATDPFDAKDTDVVTITYILTNLGSSDAEEQFANAVKVGDKVVGVVGPIAGAAIGLFFGQPQEGFKIGQEIAKGVDTAIDTFSDVFDFMGIHAGPPNCNGAILQDSIVFLPNELLTAKNQIATREYASTQENSRCGAAPKTIVTFSVQ